MEKPVLHEDPISGNCYKIRLTAALLGLPLARVAYDILKGDTRTSSFLSSISATGRIPVIQLDEHRFLPESNAACWYLAENSALIPTDCFERADMLRWMFFEQNMHEVTIATLRFWIKFVGEENWSEAQKAQVPVKKKAGEEVLGAMNDHLKDREFFVGRGVSLADIALFAYTHLAGDGGFELQRWPAVVAWCKRIQKLEGYVAMET